MTGNLNVFAPAALEAESRGVGGIVHFEIVSSVSTSSGLGSILPTLYAICNLV